MSQPGKVNRVRKVASVVWRRDGVITTSGRFLCKRLMRPSCKKTRTELMVLGRAPLTIKPHHRYSTSHATSRLLSGVLQAGQPVTFVLPCCLPPAVRGAAGWSARRIGIRLGDTVMWPSDVAKVGVSCSGVGGPTIIGPIILSPLQKSFSLCPYGAYLKRIVAELRSLKYVVGELINFSIVARYG
ncbi:hypothetical protein BHM03_00023153 [Ensete ventricosum]|nr:hypothetical protein BHM03_00023153 [Ensete ventricosum]